jgi:hypothetical protein
MNKSSLSMALMALAACLAIKPTAVDAQNDSTWLDAGMVKLKKDFTQFVSIKGQDLETMPFTNLAEALNVWIYGAYTSSNTLIYVVDGVARLDVNSYSVYDIDEAIFIQNALVQINGVAQQEQLVLITTRKHDPGGSGLTFAAKENVVTNNMLPGSPNKHARYNTGLFHEVYAGLNKQRNNVSYGLSADFQHDARPNQDDDTIHVRTTEHMDRIRLNGYVDVQADKYNEFIFRAGYLTTTIPANLNSWSPYYKMGGNSSESVHQHLFNASVSWRFSMPNGWNNDFRFSYLTTTEKGVANYGSSSDSLNLYANDIGAEVLNVSEHVDHWLLRDHLSYTARSGRWQLTPALDISLQNVDLSATVDQLVISGGGGFGGLGGMQQTSSFGSVSGSGYLLTPSLDASYGKRFDIHAGLLYNPSANHTGLQTTRVFPFASLTTDLLAGDEKKGHSSLRIFASAAMSPNYQTRDNAITDFYQSETLLNNSVLVVTPNSYTYGSSVPVTSQINTSQTYWTWDLGTSFSTPNGQFQADYHFTHYGYPIYTFNPEFVSLTVSSHRLGLRWKVAGGAALHWQSGLQFTVFSARSTNDLALGPSFPVIGDFNGVSPSWTGGWVNRFTVDRFFFGLGLLYHVNELNYWDEIHPDAGYPTHTNAFQLHDLYFGLRLPMHRAGKVVSGPYNGKVGLSSLELYLDSRNLWQSQYSDLSDYRRTFGIGAKLGI